MHSFIVQITTNNLNSSDYYNDTEVIESSIFDCARDIAECDKEEAIDFIIKELCKKMPSSFERCGSNAIRYSGDIKPFIDKFKKKSSCLMEKWNDVDNMFLAYYCSPILLKNFLENPLETDLLFCTTDETSCGYLPTKSYDFVEFISSLEKGTILYIGGIMDYHY